ncbi:MAG: hypothetical protein H6868_02995 [Rhodospirillales bacterium]|nr:hypothetical protein [Rhodospirillales bacterium]
MKKPKITTISCSLLNKSQSIFPHKNANDNSENKKADKGGAVQTDDDSDFVPGGLLTFY